MAKTEKLEITHNVFENTLKMINQINPSERWLPVTDIENSEDVIAANPRQFFEYMVWMLFTTHNPEDEDEEDARDTLEYLFDKYFVILD